MGETVAVIIVVIIAWLLYLLPAVPLSLALWYFGRKRAQFKWWELSAFVLPFIVWLVLSALSTKNKGLWSPMVEVFILGCTVPVAALIRVTVGRAVNRSLMESSLIFMICALAILLGIMIPKIEFQPFVK
jgi:hypothetical protein